MAVRRRTGIVGGMLIWSAWTMCARAEAQPPVEAVDAPETTTIAANIDISPLETTLGPKFRTRHRSRPDWWREYSDGELPLEEPTLEHEAVHLVLQEERSDGPDMLTLRYPFLATGPVRTYAGAGLGQVVYLADDGVGPILLFGRAERHRSLRAAAELGTEVRLSDELHLGADVRWLDLAERASLLRTEDGMIDASSWAARVTLGWRFR